MQLLFILVAEQVLENLRERFINEMDANVIVLDLKHQDIISDGDVETIRDMKENIQRNQFLHAHMKAKCTTEALMKVCDAIISVRGNPRMKQLGQVMKDKLAGNPYVKYYAPIIRVILCMYVEESVCVTVCMCA